MKVDEIATVLLERCVREGASDVVAMVLESEEAMVRFSNNEVTVSNDLKDVTAYVFVYCQERRAGTSVADLTKRSLEMTAERLVKAVKRSPPSDFYAPLPAGPFGYDHRLLHTKEVPTDAKTTASWVREAMQAALRNGATRVAGSLTARNTQMTIRTTGEVDGSVNKSGIELSLRAFGQGVASGHAVCVAGKERDFDPVSTGEEAGQLAKLASNPVVGSPGEYQAILGPLVFADLMQQVGRMASAFNVDAGLSFMAGRLGQKIGSDKLSLADDPTLNGTFGAIPFDHEGLPTKRTPIIDRGVLTNFLHNTITSAKAGVESTANAGLIAPQAFNLVVEPGSNRKEDLIESVDDGIYVTNDWYLRYQNYSSGDFSTIPRDAMFRIKDGEIVGSLKDLRISDNLLRILGNVKDLSRERKWIKWWEVETPTLSPTVLVDDLRFTGSSM